MFLETVRAWLQGRRHDRFAELAKSPDLERRLEVAFRETERGGLMVALLVRFVILFLLVLVFSLTGTFLGDGQSFLILAPLGLVLIGLMQFETIRRWPQFVWAKYVYMVLDCAYLAALLIFRHDFASDLPMATLAVKEGGLLFFTAFLVHAAFSYSSRFVLWTGACITIAWGSVLLSAIYEPGTFFRLSADRAAGVDIWLQYGNPAYLPVIKITYDYIIVALLAGGLAVAVWRSRQLVRSAAMVERARSNLARHFSPSVVDVISRRDRPFDEVCWQRAAVMFADIRGFTSRCEVMPPGEVVEFLRQFHSRMEDRIFAHNGTLDKMIGDGLLAVFGMPAEGPRDAANALDCAFSMLRTIDSWNVERERRGEFPVRIGIGLHYGDVMLGDVGSERLMSFTVIGDTVNVASRLEAMTKEVDAEVIASAELVDAIRCEDAGNTKLKFLTDLGKRRPRGREHDISIFGVKAADIAALAG